MESKDGRPLLKLQPEECNGIRYLSTGDLIGINHILIQLQTPTEPTGVLLPDMLASSQQSPSTFAYYQQTRDMYKLAARLIASLTQNHPFRNANKRTAFVAGAVFLMLNGYEVTGPGHEIVTLMEGLANHEYQEWEVECWLAYWSRPLEDQQMLVNPGEWLADFANSFEDSPPE